MSTHDPGAFTLRQLIDLDACTRCGECVTWCPTYAEKPTLDAITPLRKIEVVRKFIRQQHGLSARLFGLRPPDRETLETHSAGTYDCTLCGRCAAVCPVHIRTRDLWIAMREALVSQGVYPRILNQMHESITTFHNLSGESNENRLIWSENLPHVPEGVRGKERAEVVFFVSCMGSFYPQSYAVPQSFVQILDRAGVDFMALGGEEWCCGFPLIIAGMGDAALEAVQHNVEAVRRTGAKSLVTACPSCYHSWKHDYPRVLGAPLGFEVVHATEFLEQLVGDGRITLQPLEMRVTYHDPCDLGRTSGIYEPPRNLLRAVPGLTLVEMEHHHDRSLCCGGGGDVEMADAELSAAVANQRLRQAQDVEAEGLVSACQQCKRTLAVAARREKVRVRVMDIVELIAKQIV